MVSLPHRTYALHAESHIGLSLDTVLVALVECRPATTRVELGLGRVQRVATALADEVPLLGEELVVLPSPRRLSPFLSQNLKGFCVELHFRKG